MSFYDDMMTISRPHDREHRKHTMRKTLKIVSGLVILATTLFGGWKLCAYTYDTGYQDGLQLGFRAGINVVLSDAEARGFGEWAVVRDVNTGQTSTKFRWYAPKAAGVDQAPDPGA